MENWQDLLEKSGIKFEKLRKQVQKDISDYEDAKNYLSSARTALQNEENDEKKAEIQKDIEEIEADLPDLEKDIIEGINKDIATRDKRRVTASKAFGKKGKELEITPSADPKPVATSSPDPKPATVAATGIEVPSEEDKENDKESSTNIWDWIAGAAVLSVCTYLGIAYNKEIFPFNKRR